MVTAVVTDNGEPALEKCIASLRNQKTVPVRIVIASGPKTNLELAHRLADKVYPPLEGIGKARVNAILGEDDEVILSCDADTRYAENYAELAAQDLKILGFVKAGMILPAEPPSDVGLSLLEQVVSPFAPYEYAIAMRRKAFLDTGVHLMDYDSCPRSDIGIGLIRRTVLLPDPRMVCYTRLPTKSAYVTREYLPALAVAAAPFAVIGGIVGFNELDKWRRSHG
jgi:glycosyltransferase involved in cell wall biosynthesis